MGLRAFGRTLPCAIGRGGITTSKREGDGATPAGNHKIVGMMYRPDRIAPPAPWATAIRPGDLWSDDPGQADYNTKVKAPYGHSHERLRRADGLYDLILLTDWNWPRAVSGRGSAIFVHAWRKPRHPTEGCLALRAQDLLWLARRISPGSRLSVG